MIYPSILERRYQEYRPFLERTAEIVKPTLLNFCERNGYAFTSRLKTVESLAEKIETGRYRTWSDLDDLFACTIIVPTLSHEQSVIDFCRSSFSTTITKRGQSRKAPDVFRFDNTRMYAKLLQPQGLPVTKELSVYDINFEIQVRSAFEHAWSVSTHALAYKSADVDWRRQRLAAQIKATVEQLDMLILSFEQALTNVSENPWPETQRKRQIARRVKGFFDNYRIPSELAPKDFSRFCDNFYSLMRNTNNDQNIQNILNILEQEVNNTPLDRIPRSISLLQFFFAVLFRANVIFPPFNDYICHITSELISLYPDLQTINQAFDYNQ